MMGRGIVYSCKFESIASDGGVKGRVMVISINPPLIAQTHHNGKKNPSINESPIGSKRRCYNKKLRYLVAVSPTLSSTHTNPIDGSLKRNPEQGRFQVKYLSAIKVLFIIPNPLPHSPLVNFKSITPCPPKNCIRRVISHPSTKNSSIDR